MRLTQLRRTRPATPLPQAGDEVFDGRFRDLLGTDAWHMLPAPIRNRFSKRLQQGKSIAYQGVVTSMHMSRLGLYLAHAVRLIGAPLPYDIRSVGQPAVVVVTEDVATNGQFWIRQYGRKGAFPQTVHSSKRFQGPTGLEEYIGFGVGMALKVEATPAALLFKSDHYFLQLFGMRARLPRLLSPGALVIGHHEMGNNRFTFTLSLRSRWFGELVQQVAVFKDPKE
ncbi:MAG: DUF4166 domain-containing protein [Anderseniella sp.]